MSLLLTVSLLTILLAHFIVEIYFYFDYKETERTPWDWTRFEIQLGIAVSYAIISRIIVLFFGLVELMPSFYVATGIGFWVIISEFLLYNKRNTLHRLQFREQAGRKFALRATAIIIVILVPTFSVVWASIHLDAQLAGITMSVEAELFSSANWFTETLFAIIASEKVSATLGLMTIGAMVIIIAKARRSSAFAVAGFFLLIILPIFNVMDTIFTGIDVIQELAPTLFYAFNNEGLCLVIYTFIMTMFYILLTSIIIIFLSMLDNISIGD